MSTGEDIFTERKGSKLQILKIKLNIKQKCYSSAQNLEETLLEEIQIAISMEAGHAPLKDLSSA